MIYGYFLEQTKLATPAPTTRAMSLVYGPLSTAFEQAYTGTASTSDALSDANDELISLIENLQRADQVEPNPGYRVIDANISTDDSQNYTIYVDGKLHTELQLDVGQGVTNSGYDVCTADGNQMNQNYNRYQLTNHYFRSILEFLLSELGQRGSKNH